MSESQRQRAVTDCLVACARAARRDGRWDYHAATAVRVLRRAVDSGMVPDDVCIGALLTATSRSQRMGAERALAILAVCTAAATPWLGRCKVNTPS